MVFLQALAIALMAYALLQQQARVAPVASAEPPNPSTTQTDAPALSGGFSQEPVSEARLREIVAQELKRVIGALAVADKETAAVEASQHIEPDTRDATLVADEIQYHISVGTITQGDMESLQERIARLDPIRRKEMLRTLVKAMNDGRLDGRM